jgi:hypothetical protein
MKEKDQDQDESRFNDTLKRMLKTPPKPHDAEKHNPQPQKPSKSVKTRETSTK